MSEGGYKIRDQEGVYYLTFTVVNWVDVFTRKRYKDILIDSLIFCQKHKGLKIYAFVIMSNHMHCVLSCKENKLSDVIRDFKTHTSKTIIKSITDEVGESRKEWMLAQFKDKGLNNKRNKNYQFWKQDNHPIELYSNYFIEQKVDYIHKNPLESGIVEKPEEYIYSSAKNYCGEEGLLKVEFL
jgi:putative transposase